MKSKKGQPHQKSPRHDAADRAQTILIAPVAFVSLALLWCQAGYLTPVVSRSLGAILWLLAVYLAAKERRLLWLSLSALLLFNPWGPVQRGEGLWLLALLPWAGGLWGQRWAGAALLAGLGGFVWSYFPNFWVGLDEWAANAALAVSGVNLSAAAAGIPLFLLAASLPLAAMLIERRLYAPLLTQGTLVIAVLIYWILQSRLEILLHKSGWHQAQDAFSLQWVLLILLGGILLVWGYLDPPRTPAKSRARLWWAVPILVLLGALALSQPPRAGALDKNRKVVFYNKGYLNWRVPVYGSYGQHAGGMFGLVPDYLRWCGFQVSLDSVLTPELLDSAGAVVIINLMDSLNTPEAAALQEFVDRGGSLLLLGDHTGLSNIRDPSNEVLKPYGIELNFDSAKPTRTGWAGSLVAAQHPLAARQQIDRLDPCGGEGSTQIWIGASLKVSRPAQPLIVGREGFSDLGNIKNEKEGYLGNFRYSLNERLGNLVLAAEARSGQGKVLVFGDTSTLQNGALVRADDLVRRMFEYLLTPMQPAAAWARALGLMLLLAAVIMWTVAGTNRLTLCLAAATLFLGAIIGQGRMAAAGDHPYSGWTAEAHPRALLDHTHAPRTPLNQVSDDSHWGLQNTLMRSGFFPRTWERWDEQVLQDAKILVEIAPARAFSKGQREALNDFMRRGGLLIVCCGMEEFDGAKSLLADYGLQPVYLPLGPATVDTTVELPAENDSLAIESSQRLTVTFHKAWALKVSNPQARILLESREAQGKAIPLAAYVPVESGGLLYFPDTDFLTNRNLESPSDKFNEGNMVYLRYLLREFAGGR